MKKKIIYMGLILLTGALTIYSCSSKSSVAPVVVTPPAAGNTVSISNFAFVPDTIRITKGAAVTWTNKDTAPHTVTELSNAFDSGSLATSATYQRTFAAAGTFSYHCTIHSMMKTAVVIVSN